MAEDAYIWEILLQQRLKTVMENRRDSFFIIIKKPKTPKKTPKGKGRLKEDVSVVRKLLTFTDFKLKDLELHKAINLKTASSN